MDDMECIIKSLQEQLDQQSIELMKKNDYIIVLHELVKLLQLRAFASRSEKNLSPNEDVFNADESDQDQSSDEDEEETTTTIKEHERKIPKRKPLPAYLPRVIIYHDLLEENKICPCGCTLTHIGEEITEQLDIIPQQVQVLQHVRKTYACRSCDITIKTSEMPPQPIPKSMASPGLLAHILVSKYCDHLPLYRQHQIFMRSDIDLSRGTLSQWVIRCGDLLQPIINLMQEKLLEYDIAFADETTVQVLKEIGRKPESKSYMWVFGGGMPESFAWIFQYEPSRSGDVPLAFWDGFKGYLHADAYSGYCQLEKKFPIIIVNCLAHARRKFAEIVKVSKKRGVANVVVERIAELYKIEKILKLEGGTEDEIYKIRQEKSKPILEKLKIYLEEKTAGVLPKSMLGKAFAYILTHWNGLIKYLDDGRLEIDNNRTERVIKPFATGRKNWLFSDSVPGANASANIYSLIQTCKVHGVEPYKYLRYVLSEINKCASVEDYEKLLPYNYKDIAEIVLASSQG